MNQLLALIKKDLLVELRTKETLALMLALSLILTVVVACGASSAFLNPELVRRTFPAFLWLVFVFTATSSISRSYEYELEYMGIEGLILSGASPAAVYLSKVLSNFLVILIGHLFALVFLGILLNVTLSAVLLPLIGLSLLVTWAYSALATILAAMTATSRLKNMLLPLILLPLLFPIFFAALELSSDLLARGALDIGSFWFSLLVGLDVLYLLLGVNLYEYVIRE